MTGDYFTKASRGINLSRVIPAVFKSVMITPGEMVSCMGITSGLGLPGLTYTRCDPDCRSNTNPSASNTLANVRQSMDGNLFILPLGKGDLEKAVISQHFTECAHIGARLDEKPDGLLNVGKGLGFGVALGCDAEKRARGHNPFVLPVQVDQGVERVGVGVNRLGHLAPPSCWKSFTYHTNQLASPGQIPFYRHEITIDHRHNFRVISVLELEHLQNEWRTSAPDSLGGFFVPAFWHGMHFASMSSAKLRGNRACVQGRKAQGHGCPTIRGVFNPRSLGVLNHATAPAIPNRYEWSQRMKNATDTHAQATTRTIDLKTQAQKITEDLLAVSQGFTKPTAPPEKSIAKKIKSFEIWQARPQIPRPHRDRGCGMSTAIATIPTSSLPALTIHDGAVMASSLDVADKFGKRHSEVLRAFHNMEIPEDWRLRNFVKTSYQDTQGKHQQSIDMTPNGFSLLGLSFTGKEAVVWKIRYIEAFDAMEAALRQHQQDQREIDVIEEVRGLPCIAFADKGWPPMPEVHDLPLPLALKHWHLMVAGRGAFGRNWISTKEAVQFSNNNPRLAEAIAAFKFRDPARGTTRYLGKHCWREIGGNRFSWGIIDTKQVRRFQYVPRKER